MSLQIPIVFWNSFNWLLKDEIKDWLEPCDGMEGSSYTSSYIIALAYWKYLSVNT